MTPSGPNFIGMDLSGTTLRAALVNNEGHVVDRREAAISTENLVEQVASVGRELGAGNADVGAMGIGIPGLVNRQTDRVIVSRNLPTIVRDDLHSEFTRATGGRVELENDPNAAAYGENKGGAGRGSRDILYMMIGAGIGGAVILEGKLWRGASGFAVEIGLITVD